MGVTSTIIIKGPWIIDPPGGRGGGRWPITYATGQSTFHIA